MNRDHLSLARVVVPYLVFSIAWILLSDHVVRITAPSPNVVSSLQSIKGLFFVTASAAMIFLLLRTVGQPRNADSPDAGDVRTRLDGALHGTTIRVNPTAKEVPKRNGR